MSPRYTRRATLAAVGSLALAGCFADESYWDDPPAFDESGLETVTDRSVPDRPDLIPVAVADDQREAVADRIAELLAPIPEPLTAETLPNGELRDEIVTGREHARDALERMDASATTLTTVEEAVDACHHAGTAAGVWAAVSVDRSPGDVTLSSGEASGEVGRLGDELPDVAADSAEGAVVYGTVEEWLDTARRRTLVGRSLSVDGQPNPLRVGRVTGDLEAIRTEVDVGEHVRDRYVDSLADARSVEDDLASAAADLGPRTEARVLELHDEETDSDRARMQSPRLEDLLERDFQRDEPGVRLLSSGLSEFVSTIRFGPLAWPDVDVTHPALTIRRTYRAFATLEAIDAIRERVDDGDDLFPSDGETVRETREAAIDAVEDLADSDVALERWLAWQFVPAFEDPDRTLAPDAEPDRRDVVSAYGEYVWLETVARRAPAATAPVLEALHR